MLKLSRRSLGVALGAIAGTILFSQVAERKKAVSVEEAEHLIAHDSTVIVLDVRTPEEYTGPLGHIDHSLLIPLQTLEGRIGELEQYKSKRILAICRTGRRSATATEILTKHGFEAYNVEGGMVRWNEKGYRTVKSK